MGLKITYPKSVEIHSPATESKKSSFSKREEQSATQIIKKQNSDSASLQELFVKPFLNEVRDFSMKYNGSPEYLKANEINNDYIKNFTPVVYLSNYLRELWSWNSPSHTMIFGIIVTSFLKFSNYIICAVVLILYCNTAYLANVLVHLKRGEKKEKNLIEKNLLKFNRFKSNLAFIQVTKARELLKNTKYD